MENNSSNDTILNLTIDETGKAHLKTATTWARIIAICGFVGIALGLIQSIKRSSGISTPAGQATTVISFVFLIIVYIFLVIVNIYLLRFSNLTNAGIAGHQQDQFNAGIGNLRSYFKLVGIILIIVLGLCFLAGLFVGLGSAMKA